MFIMSIIHCIVIIAVASSSGGGAGASDVPPNNWNVRDGVRKLQASPNLHTGPDGRCNNLVRTKAIEEAYLGQGIFFAVQSDVDDDEGLMVSGEQR